MFIYFAYFNKFKERMGRILGYWDKNFCKFGNQLDTKYSSGHSNLTAFTFSLSLPIFGQLSTKHVILYTFIKDEKPAFSQ